MDGFGSFIGHIAKILRLSFVWQSAVKFILLIVPGSLAKYGGRNGSCVHYVSMLRGEVYHAVTIGKVMH